MERKKERKKCFFFILWEWVWGGRELVEMVWIATKKNVIFFGLPPTAQHRTRFLFSSCAILYFSWFSFFFCSLLLCVASRRWSGRVNIFAFLLCFYVHYAVTERVIRNTSFLHSIFISLGSWIFSFFHRDFSFKNCFFLLFAQTSKAQQKPPIIFGKVAASDFDLTASKLPRWAAAWLMQGSQIIKWWFPPTIRLNW